MVFPGVYPLVHTCTHTTPGTLPSTVPSPAAYPWPCPMHTLMHMVHMVALVVPTALHCCPPWCPSLAYPVGMHRSGMHWHACTVHLVWCWTTGILPWLCVHMAWHGIYPYPVNDRSGPAGRSHEALDIPGVTMCAYMGVGQWCMMPLYADCRRIARNHV